MSISHAFSTFSTYVNQLPTVEDTYTRARPIALNIIKASVVSIAIGHIGFVAAYVSGTEELKITFLALALVSLTVFTIVNTTGRFLNIYIERKRLTNQWMRLEKLRTNNLTDLLFLEEEIGLNRIS